MKTWLIILFIAASIGGTAYYFHGNIDGRETGDDKQTFVVNASVAFAAAKKIKDELVLRLKEAGWQDQAAESVVNLNLNRYCWLRQEANEVLEREFKKLQGLRPDDIQSQLLEKHPEMAGVMLMVNDPDLLASGLLNCSNDDDAARIIGSYVKYTDPHDLDVWGEAVARHGPCIAGLLRRCPAWPIDALFVAPAGNSVPENYSLWLNDIFSPAALPMSDEETLSLIEFTLAAGPEIRRRMREDSAFSDSFRDEIWPRFERCVRSHSEGTNKRVAWEFYSDVPEIWSLLQRADGEELFQRSGLLAADLLFGQEAVPIELREKVAQLLLLGNQELVEIGMSGPWKDFPEFHRLVLNRNLTDDQILACCKQLSSTDEWNGLLNDWHTLSDSALIEEIGPPPEGLRTMIPGYGIYYAAKKLTQGRGLGWSDAFGIGGDVITLATLGTATVVMEPGKAAAKGAGAKVVKEASKSVVKQALKKEAVKDLAIQATKEIAEGASRRELGSLVAHQALKALPEKFRQALIKGSIIDVTDWVKASFTICKKLGLGRESVKRMTGLEARIFMRGDAQVLVNLPKAAFGRAASAQFLNATAENWACDKAMVTVAGVAMAAYASPAGEKELSQQNLACWWSGLATDSFENSKQTE